MTAMGTLPSSARCPLGAVTEVKRPTKKTRCEIAGRPDHPQPPRILPMNTTRDPWARAVTGIAQSAFLLNSKRLGVRHPHARASYSARSWLVQPRDDSIEQPDN